MKNIKRQWLILGGLIVVIVAIAIGCGVTNSGGGGGSSVSFYTEASDTTPVFLPSTEAQSASIKSIKTKGINPWGTGNPLYAVYYSLREYVFPRDEGIVDRSNLYKLIKDVDTVYSGISPYAQNITEQEITPPFNQLSALTADKAINDEDNKMAIALKDDGSLVNAVQTWIWTDSPSKEEVGVARLSFNRSNNRLNVQMTYSVDYDLSSTEADYCSRCNVSGDALANEFEYKYIIGNQSMTSAQIVAKGVSRGAGNYMLFKYAGAGQGTKYIVVPGDADENFFIAQNENPTLIFDDPDNLPASVEAYKTWVVGQSFLATSDMVTDTAILNEGTTLEGTIYINYN